MKPGSALTRFALDHPWAVAVLMGAAALFLSLNVVVVGVVNETHPSGVFNPRSLRNIHALTECALTLKGATIGESDASFFGQLKNNTNVYAGVRYAF